jgi:hypothetical protein
MRALALLTPVIALALVLALQTVERWALRERVEKRRPE